MANPTKRQVRARVKWWQKRLGLQRWKIAVEFGKDSDGAEAACSAAPEYLHATIFLDLSQIPAEQMDRYIVHELSHCFVWALANAAHALASGDKSKEEWVRTEEETLTTRLEDLLLQLGTE